jgi:hypothetical protein
MTDETETGQASPAPDTTPAQILTLPQEAIDAFTRAAKDSVAAVLADFNHPELIPGDVLAAIEPDLKPLLKSKTLWSLAVAAAALIAQRLGHPITPETQTALLDNLATVVEGLGLVFAAIFRITGSQRLG